MEITSLTPSGVCLTDNQVGELHKRLLAACRRSEVSSAQFQLALAYPGTELEEKIVATLVRFSRKATGIVTPVRAEESGLVPYDDGWDVEKDKREDWVDLAKLDFDYCPVEPFDGNWINGETLLERASEAKAIGSLGLAKAILDAQKAGKDVFPLEARDKVHFVLPLTILRDRDRNRRVASFSCGGGGRRQWAFDFDSFSIRFGRDTRLLRVRK